MSRSRTPWFSVRRQPPLRPGVYEFRCPHYAHGKAVRVHDTEWIMVACKDCQWRGLTKPAKGEK